eukprot:28474-Eustigmatos_ZCMA.PRE.1
MYAPGLPSIGFVQQDVKCAIIFLYEQLRGRRHCHVALAIFACGTPGAGQPIYITHLSYGYRTEPVVQHNVEQRRLCTTSAVVITHISAFCTRMSTLSRLGIYEQGNDSSNSTCAQDISVSDAPGAAQAAYVIHLYV